ncbi:transcriptional regulator, LacI family [Arthrobacter sp. yr096]|uniref:LacI family DNA-binding transcriptional regulator n=1 Tax=unclassified Arthrobacter TaxID=235627 RepID=UPI000895019D|nr:MULTISPECIES: LacI family DNA-binding transcriptional regulator [unclassified Arthrobacter]SDW06397.1 transcriptional regulator, LacI family [Arthrobacter sp. cf158]SEI74566.1 transcriptional regulator, LacI family [Arthrobacter sp. yr096]
MARELQHGATIWDVARRAGVSITTVSHSLNGKGNISQATRERVRAVAAEMGYVADAMARGLRSSKMNAIGLVFRSLDSLGNYGPNGVDVFMKLAGAAASETLNRNLGLMLVPDLSRGPLPPFSMSLDGYIVFAPHLDDPVVALLEKRGIPYVTWDRDPGRPDFRNWVAHNDAASTRTVLDHLAAAGARSIAYVGGTDRNAWNFDCEAAYVAWCLETGAEPRIYHVPERDGVEGGQEVGGRILADGLPGAVFCLTGRHASGAAQALQERGVRIPGDLLVCTGSDSEHSRQHKPPISALDVDIPAAAAALVQRLCEVMEGASEPEPVLLAARFLHRKSTSPVKGRTKPRPGS